VFELEANFFRFIIGSISVVNYNIVDEA